MLLCLNLGLKNLYEGEGEVPPFFAAACELVLGLLPIVGELKHTQRFVSIATNSMPHAIYICYVYSGNLQIRPSIPL